MNERNGSAVLHSKPTQTTAVGYKSPPVHTRFKPGQSGNPSGRRKGSKNLRTLFNEILNELVAVREGADVRKVTKAEAILRSQVLGALKGDQRCVATLFRFAEHTGHFEEPISAITNVNRIVLVGAEPCVSHELPADRDFSREQG